MTEPSEGEVKEVLTEAVAESDEELLEKYFSGEEFTDEEFTRGLTKGIASRFIIPIMTSCALDGRGVKEFLDAILKYAPAPGIIRAMKVRMKRAKP